MILSINKGFNLPDDFLFGVSNSGFQTEGGYNRDGEPHNNWAEWERTGKAEATADCCHFWDRYGEHISRAKDIGMNAFRIGIEWARIQPSYSESPCPPPPWDEHALDGYAKIIGAIMNAGMEPVVTLHHFSHPAWLGTDLWLDDSKACMWADFAIRGVQEINRRLTKGGNRPVEFWVTINEPNILALQTYIANGYPYGQRGFACARQAMDNLLLAHVRAYDGIHDLYEEEGWGRPMVAFNTCSLAVYEFDRAIFDLMRAPALGVARTELKDYLRARRTEWNKRFTDLATFRWGGNWLQVSTFHNYRAVCSWLFNPLVQKERAIEAVYASRRKEKVDFLGLDIYDPFLVGSLSLRLTKPILRLYLLWWEWHHDARHFGTVIRAHHQGSPDLPIYILENGMCHLQKRGGGPIPRRDGLTREKYLRMSIGEVVNALREGTPIKGYFYWSLTDNYEWGSFESRFGLYGYDYEKGRITDTDGFGVHSGKVYAQLVESLRSGDMEEIQRGFGPGNGR